MDYEKKQRLIALRNSMKEYGYADGVEELESIFPELRESEDERIRKEIIGYLNSKVATAEETELLYFKRWIAYLEKQKDNKFAPRVLPCSAAWFEDGEEKQKEHQNKSDAQEKALGRDLTFPHDKDKNLDEIAQDYVDGVKEYNPDPTWDLMQTAVCYGYHYCEQKEQKPEEFDTKAFQDGVKEGRRLERQDMKWSEEDEKNLEFVIDCIYEFYPDPVMKYKLKDWLKSLRPQYHGDVTMTEAYKMRLEAGKASSWKPSEEQMKKDAVEGGREMREIKFRGKSNIFGWVYGCYAVVNGHAHIFEEDDLVEDGHHICQESDRPTWVDENTVGQYTGLKDEDGVEIFEGDIVEVHEAPFNWSIIGVVIYDPETAHFLIREQNKKYPRDFRFQKHDTYNDGYCTVECESDFHVLGNIHDNPELA